LEKILIIIAKTCFFTVFWEKILKIIAKTAFFVPLLEKILYIFTKTRAAYAEICWQRRGKIHIAKVRGFG
jgi:hypothetical protein